MCTFVEKSEDTWEFEMFIKEDTKLNKIFILKYTTNNYKDKCLNCTNFYIFMYMCIYMCPHIYTHNIYTHTCI